MKKIIYLVAVCAVVAAMGSCNKKAGASAGMTAKRMVEHIMNDNYEAFVDQIEFTETPPAEVRKAVNRAHAVALRTIHKPNVDERGGSKEVKVVSEKMSADQQNCEVTLANHYNNGLVSTVEMQMTKKDGAWKVRETPYKEIWKTTTSEGDTEVIKIRSGHKRDFLKEKNKTSHEKQFIKDVVRRNGEIEVIKVLENGQRHREVIRKQPEIVVDEIIRVNE